MESRRVIFTEPCVAQLQSHDLNAPGKGEVQVKIMVSSVSSGTERANLIGDPNISPNSKGGVMFPRRPGYSAAGEVVALGEGVTEFAVGDRVATVDAHHWSVDNVPVEKAVRIPEGVSFENAALSYISVFPMAAIRKCRLELGESAIVMGLGMLGLVAIPLLKTAGAAPIIAVDPVAEKREKALAIGADYALDPFAPDFAETAKKLTDGGAKVGIEVTGVGAGLDGILDCMARFGRVALLGCTRNKEFTIDYYRKVHGPGISLIGAHTNARPAEESAPGWWTRRDDMTAMLKLTQMGRLDLASLIDEVHTPLEAPEVYARLAREKAFPLVQFDWRKLG